MESCLFCRIIAGTISAHLVHESAGAVAFLDAYPVARPHVLVVPRVHASTLLDLDGSLVGELFRTVNLANGLGIHATPTFVVNGVALVGAVPESDLVSAVERARATAEASGIPSADYYDKAVLGL